MKCLPTFKINQTIFAIFYTLMSTIESYEKKLKFIIDLSDLILIENKSLKVFTSVSNSGQHYYHSRNDSQQTDSYELRKNEMRKNMSNSL